MSGLRQESWSLITAQTFNLLPYAILDEVYKENSVSHNWKRESFLVFFGTVPKLEKWDIVKGQLQCGI